MKIVTTQSYENKEKAPEASPEEKTPQSVPEPDPQTIINDFLHHQNVAPLVLSSSDEKVVTAGMRSNHFRHTTFIECFSKLPNKVKNMAREQLTKAVANPSSVDIHKIKQLGQYNVYACNISSGKPSYRALAVKMGPYYIWYWIGTHEAYNTVIYKTPPTVSMPPAAQQAMNRNDGSFQREMKPAVQPQTA